MVALLFIPSLIKSEEINGRRKISPSDPIIKTENGPVRGILENFNGTKISKFYGVPYALPPTGSLRFKKSAQLNYSWAEPMMAFHQPNFCFQGVNMAIEAEVGRGGGGDVSEDCLYLNIFAPGLTNANKNSKSRALKPVMVWVHGENFYSGSVSQPTFDGKALAVMGDIIVVTINYRLGPFGFLYTGSTEDDAPGNQGLWDVLNAVYWVTRNIKSFGGDPKKVTLVGHASGGIMVSMAAISPAFDQLLNSFIIMSGSALGNWVEPKTISTIRAHRIAYQLGCASEGHLFNDCFKTADAHLLSIASQSRLTSPSFDPRIYNYFTVVPQYGDQLVPIRPSELVKLYPKTKRILMGSTDFEGSPLLAVKDMLVLDPRISIFTISDREATWQSGFREMIGREMMKVNESTKDLLVDYYFEQSLAKRRMEWAYEVLQFWGDYNVLCPTIIQAEMMSENLNDVFLYRFSYINNVTTTKTECKGYNLSCHGMEVPLLFAKPFLAPDSFDINDRAVSRDMIDTFARFMAGKNKFPKITLSQSGAYTFGKKLPKKRKMTFDWNKDVCDLLKPFILVDDELELKIADDLIGMRTIQSIFGLPARLTNRFYGMFISYLDRFGYYLLPWGRYFMDKYNSLAQQLNQAPSISEFMQYIYSIFGLTNY